MCSVIAITATPPSLPLLLSLSSYVFDHRYHYNSLPLLAITHSIYVYYLACEHALGIKPATPGHLFVPRGHLFMPRGHLCMPQGYLFVTLSHCLETKGHLFVPWGQLFVLLICYTDTKSSPHIYLFFF